MFFNSTAPSAHPHHRAWHRHGLAVLTLAAPLTLLAACGQPTASSRVAETRDGATVAVEVTDAWCRATPGGARAAACFATFRATGRDDRLVTLTTPAAEVAEVHTMSTEGGMMRMSPLPDGLTLPAGEPVTLAPGGTHLMLMGLAGPLSAGDQVPLTLSFETGSSLVLQVPVRAAGAG